MTKLKAITAVLATAIITLTATGAHADQGVRQEGVIGSLASAARTTQTTAKIPPHRLQVNTYTCDFAVTGDCVESEEGFSTWVKFPRNGQDSPLDPNTKALVVHTPSTDLAAYDYTELYSDASLNINKPATSIRNLSFDAYKPALRGGSPRIDVFFGAPLADGSSYAAIDAGNCQQALASATWVRADATGRTLAGCTIYTSNGTPFTSDGTSTAWQLLNAANPGAVVTYTFMVIDIPTGSDTAGDYRIDRIALGTGKYYNASNFAVNCGSEGAC